MKKYPSQRVQLIDRDGTNHGPVPIARRDGKGHQPGVSTWSRFPLTPPRRSPRSWTTAAKYRFQEQKKAAEARKKQKIVEIKEIKLRPMIDDHDYEVKMRSMRRFFEEGDKVKVTLRFRGREMAHQELGTGCSTGSRTRPPVAKVGTGARMEGRQMVMVLAPR